MKLIEKTVEELLINKLVKKNDKILLGLSGGADSVFLFHVFLNLKNKINFFLSCAHVNYNLRGDDSRQNLEFCQKLCEKFNVFLFNKELNYSKTNNLQEKARNDRYDFFYYLLEKKNLDKVAVAHNSDDNSETVFFNIIRGAGIGGIRGLKKDNEKILRPVLNLSAQEIRNFLKKEQIDFCVDKSNFENKYNRNLIRNSIFPAIQKINPNIKKSILNLASGASDYEEAVLEFYHRCIDDFVFTIKKNKKYIIKKHFFSISKGKKRVFFYNFFKKELKIQKGIYRNNINEIIKMAGKNTGKFIILSNFIFFNCYKYFEIIDKDYFELEYPDFEDEIIPDSDFSSQLIKISRSAVSFIEKNSVSINSKKLKWPLMLRHRKKGDKISKNKSLKKLLIDKKINKLIRNRIPVLTDSENNIIWIPGVFIKKFKKTDLVLKFKRRLFWIKE
ncbi:MAG: tRNA lysidine(34) synthetase TilS [Candidatus Muiribacteriota bacterium]